MDHSPVFNDYRFFDGEAAPRRCPDFCGRPADNVISANVSACQSCPWGEQPAAGSLLSICEPCADPLGAYDYAFLVFHAIVPWLVHALFLRLSADQRIGVQTPQRKRLWLGLQALSAGIEALVALILGLLMAAPRGSLALVGCPSVGGLRDWYPALVEPPAGHIRCTGEIVYPLYSLPFVILAFCLINAAILRTFLYTLARYGFHVRLASAPVYATLWALPLCALAHALLSGLIYYSFPYICMAVALVLNAVHLATLDSSGGSGGDRRGPTARQICALLTARERRAEHAALLGAHAALLTFGGASLAAVGSPTVDWLTLALVAAVLPAPTVFYVLTAGLTAPALTRGLSARHRR